MDTFEEERARGKTVEVGRAFFHTSNKRYTILDAPGHRNYIPHMIIGVSQADVAVLVISAKRGEFESGFTKDGQTREHAILAKTLGIKKLIVVINKMDEESVGWSKERYDEIVKELTPFLKSTGYNLNKEVIWLPLSGFSGLGIKEPIPKEVCPWWEGGTLFEVLDSIQPLERMDQEPLRIPVLDKIKEKGYIIVMGKVETGIISVGQSVIAMPGRTQFTVALIENEEGPIKRAKPGENVKLLIKASHLDEDHIYPGFVISEPNSLTPVTDNFVASIYIIQLLDHKSIFSAGYKCVLHIHTSVQEAECIFLLEKIDKKTGKTEEKLPKFVPNGSIVIAHIKTSKPVCMEKFSDFPQLGRFTLRDEGRTIAYGKILATNAPIRKRKKETMQKRKGKNS